MVLKLADTLQNELALNLQTQSSIHPGKGLIEDKNTFCQGPDQEGRVIFVLTRGTQHPDMDMPWRPSSSLYLCFTIEHVRLLEPHLFYNIKGPSKYSQKHPSPQMPSRLYICGSGQAVSIRVPVSVEARLSLQSSIAGWRRCLSTSTTSGVMLLFVVAWEH